MVNFRLTEGATMNVTKKDRNNRKSVHYGHVVLKAPPLFIHKCVHKHDFSCTSLFEKPEKMHSFTRIHARSESERMDAIYTYQSSFMSLERAFHSWNSTSLLENNAENFQSTSTSAIYFCHTKLGQ